MSRFHWHAPNRGDLTIMHGVRDKEGGIGYHGDCVFMETVLFIPGYDLAYAVANATGAGGTARLGDISKEDW